MLACFNFLEPFLAGHEKEVLALIPVMASDYHKVFCEPDLPKKSQLFRKEWAVVMCSEIRFDPQFFEQFVRPIL